MDNPSTQSMPPPVSMPWFNRFPFVTWSPRPPKESPRGSLVPGGCLQSPSAILREHDDEEEGDSNSNCSNYAVSVHALRVDRPRRPSNYLRWEECEGGAHPTDDPQRGRGERNGAALGLTIDTTARPSLRKSCEEALDTGGPTGEDNTRSLGLNGGTEETKTSVVKTTECFDFSQSELVVSGAEPGTEVQDAKQGESPHSSGGEEGITRLHKSSPVETPRGWNRVRRGRLHGSGQSRHTRHPDSGLRCNSQIGTAVNIASALDLCLGHEVDLRPHHDRDIEIDMSAFRCTPTFK